MAKSDLKNITELLVSVIEGYENDSREVTRYRSADELSELIDISLGEDGCSFGELTEFIHDYLSYTPNSAAANYNKLLYSGTDKAGLLGDWVSSLSNATMHTYQVAPVATLIELELVRQLNHLIGFDSGDGIMVSGGTMANMVAMMLARYQAYPDIREAGLAAHKPLVAFVSELAHYSFEKAANVLGIGSRNLISVKADDDGGLNPDALRESIKLSISGGKQPFFIGLTAGTTVLGSFDRVKECSAVAKEFDCWLHIDGAWGGPAVFSSKLNFLKDSFLADSFTWDAHKLMNVPLTASLILVKNDSILEECCSGGGGEYLFHADENDDFNLGKKSLQCGRRVDSLKFWLSWKAKGSLGYQKKIDDLLDLKDYALSLIHKSPNLQLLAPSPYLNILFRYQPNRKLSNQQLDELNCEICKVMLREDIGFVDYARYKESLGIRYILANEEMTEATVEQFLDQCIRIGDRISAV